MAGKLSKLHAAYLKGFRRGYNMARTELTRDLGEKLAAERERMSKEVRAWLDNELASMRSDLRAIDSELDRRRAIDQAVVTERDPATPLN
jgi:hypothetical protein